MTYRCDTCKEKFKTLTKKRLHDCSGSPAELQDIPGSLSDALPKRFLTVDEAAALDETGAKRFFPLLSIGRIAPSTKVIAGYAKTENGHLLLAFNNEAADWYVIERNEDTASFNHSEDDLLWYVCERSDVDPDSVFGYDSSDPDYPQLGI